MYVIKKAKLKKHLIPIMIFSFLPEAVVVYATIDISMKVFSHSATIGDYSFVTALLTQLASSIIFIVNSGMLLYENMLKIDNVKSFDNIPKNVKDIGATVLNSIETIEFKDISFSYPGTQKKVLTDISFKVSGKEKLCIVGLNGSGKTTIIKLLLRFYETDTGDILFKNLAVLWDGKIAIFTSHRLSNVSMASKVIVIEQGKVIEYGTRDELLKMSGRFAELFNYQAEKYSIHNPTQA